MRHGWAIALVLTLVLAGCSTNSTQCVAGQACTIPVSSCFAVIDCLAGTSCTTPRCQDNACAYFYDDEGVSPQCEGDCVSGMCILPDHCANRVQDQDELGIDCGGTCQRCDTGMACIDHDGCKSGSCFNGTCAGASCSDGVQNGSETDVDCGSDCAPCGLAASCVRHADCQRDALCIDFACATPVCSLQGPGIACDPATDDDCSPRCLLTAGPCFGDSQCESGRCEAGQCLSATCNDMIRNGDESGIDCGGSCTNGCQVGTFCVQNGDCLSGTCDAFTSLCVFGESCSDGVKIKLKPRSIAEGAAMAAALAGAALSAPIAKVKTVPMVVVRSLTVETA